MCLLISVRFTKALAHGYVYRRLKVMYANLKSNVNVMTIEARKAALIA